MNMRHYLLTLLLLSPMISPAIADESTAEEGIKFNLHGCDLLLQRNEIRKIDRIAYAFDLLSATQDQKTQLDIIGNVVTGDFAGSYGTSNVASSLSKHISYDESHDFLTKFLTKDQLEKYVECARGDHGGLSAAVVDFDDDHVSIEVSYALKEPNVEPFALRNNVKVEGVETNAWHDLLFNDIPNTITNFGQPVILSFKRKHNAPFRFELLAHGQNLIIKIPVMPKFPCLRLDNEGHCTVFIRQGKFDNVSSTGGPGKRLLEPSIDADWDWNIATIDMGGEATYTLIGGGAAGAVKATLFAITDAGTEIVFNKDSLAFIGPFQAASWGDKKTFGNAFVHKKAAGNIRQLGLYSPECRSFAGPFPGTPDGVSTASCSFTAVAVVTLAK